MTRIAAPAPPRSPQAFRFPVVASLAPLVVAVVLWLVTNSPYSLLFALLGPVTAAASLLDSRWGGRRARRREQARFADDARAARVAIDSAHEEELAALAERAPGVLDILTRRGADPWRWSCGGPAVPVALGKGSVASAVIVEGDAEDLSRRAAFLPHAPVVVDASLGIGIVGPPVLTEAFARALAVEVAWALSPAAFWVSGCEPWVSALPHARQRPQRRGVVAEFGDRGTSEPLVTIAAAAHEGELPGDCRIIVAVTPEGSAIVQHPDRSRRGAVRLEAATVESARAWAVGLAEAAAREGVTTAGMGIPETVDLADLLGEPSTSPGLSCVIGVDARGPVSVDLLEQGPHAVVGGTTGSGKSELLVSWVVGLAAVAPPDRVTVLLVDFKGGAAFASLAHLPHTVGIVTDLDETGAARALASLRAELRYRERAIAEAHARDIGEVQGIPRLVIVVDEFAAMLADHPDLHALFADIAARGRSLGVHLILCTQRPAGVVRDAVLANADLRLSFRVNNRADSVSVVGTEAAADLPARAKGRGILAPPDGEPRVVQFALSSAADVERVASRWSHVQPPRRPWCDPLPTVVTPAEASGGFGLVDVPQEQRRGLATWNPPLDGNLIVLGAARSGTTTALAALAPHAILVPPEVGSAWDVLEAEHSGVLAVDDVDSLLARFPAEYRPAVVDRLAALLRDGPRRGLHVVLGARRITSDLQSLAALAPGRLLLRHSSRHDWVLAGGEGAEFLPGLPPGGGVWRGHRVQVALTPASSIRPPAALVGDLRADRPLAIVTTRARVLLTRLPRARALGDGDASVLAPNDVVVGDVEEWQSRWGALTAARQVAEVMFDACTPADVRALTRSRDLPPPLTGLGGVGWRLEEDGRTTRVRFDPDRLPQP